MCVCVCPRLSLIHHWGLAEGVNIHLQMVQVDGIDAVLAVCQQSELLFLCSLPGEGQDVGVIWHTDFLAWMPPLDGREDKDATSLDCVLWEEGSPFVAMICQGILVRVHLRSGAVECLPLDSFTLRVQHASLSAGLVVVESEGLLAWNITAVRKQLLSVRRNS